MFIDIITQKRSIRAKCEVAERLSDVLLREGVLLRLNCGGNGSCGKCFCYLDGEGVLSCEHFLDGGEKEVRLFEEESIYIKEETFSLLPLSPIIKEGFGASADIGTTSVSLNVYSFPSGELVFSKHEENLQCVFGRDVLSRCTNNYKEASDILVSQIKRMISESNKDVKALVVSGNSIMCHSLLGLDTRPLGMYPYKEESRFGKKVDAFLPLYILPSVQAFFGGDAVGSVLYSNMLLKPNSLLIDFGTNAEIAYFDGKTLFCTSAASGSALEKGVASSGAIDSVWVEGNKFHYSVIGNTKPTHLCGSGLIDAISCMLTLGIIDKDGVLKKDFEIGNSSVFISQQDIRDFQVAKSAVKSAIKLISKDISKLYIAGGFSALNIDNAQNVGIIPKTKSTAILGNAALKGATSVLFDESKLNEAVKIANNAVYTDLAKNENFYSEFISEMHF